MNTVSSDLSAPQKRGGFFSRTDWASFWTATIASFVVYFFTVAPSVTLEDAGELVTAGDHLGVPHPPGYPIWTVCAFLFARLLGFVKYMGQPNPAWAIALMSGFFGAVAAGMTAMLITRSSADMLEEFDHSGDPAADRRRHTLLSWVGGVAGSLVFAFSPVEWSQATIPEVYTLNALFLMWVFLLSYRWMRQPSDKVLWAVAFIFGLGLTNYQVLLFAIVPLAIIILLKDIGLFRDLALASLPFLLTAGILMLGAEVSKPGFPKCAAFKGYEDLVGPPLASPMAYLVVVLLLAAAVGVALYVGLRARKGEASKDESTTCAIALTAIGVAALVVCLCFPTAAPIVLPAGYNGPVFSWALPSLAFFGLLAAIWALAWFTPGGRWYAGAVTIVEVALAILLKKGCLLGLTHPQTGWFAFYVALNFAFIGLAWALLPRGRSIALAVLCAEVGVAFYGYMPIASDTNPPMNWGYPRTWTGFKHAISRGQYEKISPTGPFDPIVVEQLGAYFSDLRKQFTLLLVPLGFLPFALWRIRAAVSPMNAAASIDGQTDGQTDSRQSETGPARRSFDCFTLAFGIACVIAVLAAIDRLWNKADAFVSNAVFAAALAAIALCVAVGFATVAVRQLFGLWRTARDASREMSERIASGLCLAGAVLGLLVAIAGFSRAIAAFRIVGSTPTPDELSHAFPAILALTAVFAAIVLGVLFLVGYFATQREKEFGLKIGDTSQQWLVSTFACFLMMSFLFIVMAAPKGDLQDNFIQKVKFISSHAMFSLWIGYGIAFGLAAVAHRLPRALVAAAAVAILVGAPLIPIYENYTNDQLIEEMSSASQDGHDFGWQFGNYQLRGAEAIAEELRPDEEPLPNPEFPPAMTTNAVFYGGTDPGRFVPTYMIFSADVRPDVFLITQNALADNTYMDTMRDMYGDQIWMPTQKDNGAAFTQYVEDVKAGRKPNYGDISFEGGRVQVTGALAVMEINGILTEQIFMQNRDRHDFYVEESYTLRWMYPYETPHGLIMKIEHDPTPLTAKRIRDDNDFWDWYSRRLLATPKYKRDLTARKSFSKLRSSIAGLYTARGRMQDSERAFREAVRLYPASPESNLRLVQEVLMPFRRFGEALRLLGELQSLDPNNKRLPDIIAQVANAEKARITMETYGGAAPKSLGTSIAFDLAEAQISLQHRAEAGKTLLALVERLPKLSAEETLRVGMLCASLQLHREAAQAFAAVPPDTLVATGKTAPDVFQAATASLINGGRLREANTLLVRQIKSVPGDWKSWLELALVRSAQNLPKDAAIAMEQARKIVVSARASDQEEFMKMLETNPMLGDLFRQMYKPQQGPLAQPQPKP